MRQKSTKGKKWPFHFPTFLSGLRMENTYISKMTRRKCWCTRSTITQFPVLSSFVFFKLFLSLPKLADIKCLGSCCHSVVQAAYCLVNLWIISGEFPLNCSSAADSSWLSSGEQAEARCSPGPALHFAWSLFPGPHQYTVRLSLCPRRSPLCSSSVILALLQTHSTDILKNSGIHPQYGFLLIIAFRLWRLHLLLTLQSHDYLHGFFFLLPSTSQWRPAIILPLISYNRLSLSLLCSYFFIF